jgi:tRNA-specific 2-thiouridylase
MRREKIAVALSGGVDSSYAAYLLKRQGYQLVGITFKIPFSEEENIKRASYICQRLDFPHHIVDISDEFTKLIINYFIDSYLDGLTPNPCALCNRVIKFDMLLNYAYSLGCQFLATGHYARLIKENDKIYLTKSRSNFKSQEYFLGLVPKEKFKSVIFPLGDYIKEEVRENIQEMGIYPFKIRESEDICFIRERNYKEFIESRIANFYRYFGNIKYRDGRVLGRHKGTYSFTYGQREGLGISWSEPLYVLDINPQTKEVVVGERVFALKDRFLVESLNWFYPPRDYENLQVKTKYNSPSLSCRIEMISEREILCKLKEEKDMPSPGQLAVFYDNDRVVAGGWIGRGSF